MRKAYCQYCGKELPLGSDAMIFHEELFCDFDCVSSFVSDEVEESTCEGKANCEHCGKELNIGESIVWYFDSQYCCNDCVYSTILDEVEDQKITEVLDYEDDW